MAEYAGRLAQRYRGQLAAYVPVVEAGYWTAMMTDWGRWWPAAQTQRRRRWWELYAVVGRMLVAMARAVRDRQPTSPPPHGPLLAARARSSDAGSAIA